MAQYTLYPTRAIGVDSSSSIGQTGTWLPLGSSRKIALAFDDIPPALARQKLNIAVLDFAIDRTNNYSLTATEIISDWGWGINYNTFPETDASTATTAETDSSGNWWETIELTGRPSKGIAIESPSSINISISHSTAGKPELRISATAVIPTATNRLPVNNAYVPFDEDTVFRWDIGTDEQMYAPEIAVLEQTSAIFKWRYKGEIDTNDIPLSGSTSTVEIPANTFDDERDIQWQAIITSNDGATSNTNIWHDISTSDNISTAQIISPVDTFIDGTVANKFTWQHVIDSGTTQTAYDLQVTVSDEWTDFISETTANQFATIPANSFPAGQNQWRVRTYNSDGVAGNWSEAALIIVRAAPQQPMITSISNAARPVVSWQSLQQQGYRITVSQSGNVIYDSGITASIDKHHKITDYLANGTYAVNLVIYNQYGLGSPVATFTATVETPKPYKPTLAVESIRNGVKLTVTDGTNTIYILRDGVPIKKLAKQAEWIDYISIGTHEYIARVVDSSDNFEDSDTVTGATVIDTATIAAVDNPENYIELSLRRDDPVSFGGKITLNQSLQYFAGREYPVAEFDEHTAESRELSHSVLKLSDFEQFKNLVKRRKTLIYRNNYGDSVFGIVSDVSNNYDSVSCDFNFTVQCVSFSEGITYD